MIDFAARLYDLPAKEAAHLLACAYGIQPYSADDSGVSNAESDNSPAKNREVPDQTETPHPATSENGDYIERAEFDQVKGKYDDLRRRFERLSNVVFGYLLEHDEICHQQDDHVPKEKNLIAS